MIGSHMWFGWWREWPDRYWGPPEYGPCEVLVDGEVCGQPRHEHSSIDQARKYDEDVASD